jgi:uncharacterized protein
MRAAVVLLAALALGAYKPPPLNGHVVDTTGSLSAEDVRDLDLTIDAMGNTGGFALVVLVTGLDGMAIEDIAYTAFNTWGIGEKGKDNGVLLVIAPQERRVRIETGKGIGGALPDLRTNDIIRTSIAPYLKQGQLRTAIEDGAIAIAQALRADDSWKRSETRREPGAAGGASSSPWQIIGGIVGVLVLLLVLGRRRRGGGGGGSMWRRGGGWGGGGFGGWGGGGFGGWGGGGFGGGGGGAGGGWSDGGGSGYTGGGGHSGGGGSNDSF